MQKYYIFNIKDEFKYVFKNREKALYNFIDTFTQHPTSYLEKQAGLMFVPFNNSEMSTRFKDYFVGDDGYRKLAHLHILEDTDKHQLSYLKIERYNLVLETDNYHSKFAKVILQSYGNYVIIDFDERECHWLDNLTMNYGYGG